MSHTTKLADGWIAIHNSRPFGDDIVLLRHVDANMEITVPAKVLFQFTAECARNLIVSVLEEMDTEQLMEP